MAGVVSLWKAYEKDTLDKVQGKNNGNIKELVADSHYRKIGERAFKNNTKLRRVILPENVVEIGAQSFYNTMLREVELKGTILIRKEAFYNCTKLKQVKLPKTTNFIGNRAFAQCKSLERMEIDVGSICREVKAEAFSGCVNLKHIALPATLERIERRAFYKCTALEQIVLPERLREIGAEAFYQNALTSLELPEGLIKIGDSAFLKCNSLQYAKILSTVKVIEKWAFHGCNRLKVLEIGHDPEEIGPWVINRSAKIRCKKGGAVEKYCRDSGFETEYI